MTNKEQLQINNASLDECINRINAAKDVAATLPESGGASIEAWTGTVYGTATGLGEYPDIVVYYTDETLSSRSVSVPTREEAIITIAAHTLIAVYTGVDINPPYISGTNINGLTGDADVVLPTADGFTING